MDIKIPELIIEGVYTSDGAGVKLERIFGSPRTVQITDPFLLLDFFGSSKLSDYENGFPWHPHRGIETITLQLRGKTYHEDSEGHKGIILPGELQWMTAGSGIFHQEMPKPIYYGDKVPSIKDDANAGIQLWLNMPAANKMDEPAYRSIREEQVPVEEDDYGNKIGVISGNFKKVAGALNESFQYELAEKINPYYLRIKTIAKGKFETNIPEGHRAIIFVIGGLISVNDKELVSEGRAVILSTKGKLLSFYADQPSDVIIIAGRPLNEPISWYGPIVMNTREEIAQAIKELNDGTFIKENNPLWQ
ncbi:hypothetical protein [Thermoplasma volcanium GSS1]|uniref:Pirin family protein n=1 Tax=Thermoplasma volcanium (strain ATCC 51530 / DSM 4299 / JCM 9571 / NBRC 15438 / GSS1) TaxID=273116 RepID=Q97C91_THEVO|nr:pirin family protein [Thermoplasma volcanium]BAB59354.1 hypothetical protein [Thermoplasma volcanium GSS1]